ncbi:GTP 3',8-cyclase MoaA [Undibacterium oligocarboniphilum]|uniref:GTP 3',8-cyclase n=1 Tax=Undibacterium oligocarboniphilum TaxID=666702 RepID=A0A850QHN0_9BURK|nr:GTP 3',8-cyclase MoaA [Undibacterium oligocarboniphilum]MBC3868923.1 GTP 3',8-cyclase MoaA [Undibacterium oligocarboniphilum]NVO76903.1 GTP 3',8-cyclase MoaA [Undibacterium oligocarboniphilum]
MDTTVPHSQNQVPALTDRFGRQVSYLRLSVTDRCDLRCSYCMPKGFSGFEEPENWLRFDEIERVVAAFSRMGVARVRLTGGEPLLRRNLPQLVSRLFQLPGLQDISLSTNATQLHKHARALRDAGVSRINVSLDSLDKACMQQITGRDSFGSIMAGLQAGKQAGFMPIKLNMVVMRGVNDHEISRMARFCFEEGFILRLIETMPMGATGRDSQYLDIGPIREQLVREFDLVPAAAELGGGPARYWSTRDGRGTIGFISPISQHFCATCNRVRLSVDGTLYMCLGQDEKFALRPLLRAGISDAGLDAAIRSAIELKPERHEFTEQPLKIVRFMSQTGG